MRRVRLEDRTANTPEPSPYSNLVFRLEGRTLPLPAATVTGVDRRGGFFESRGLSAPAEMMPPLRGWCRR